MPAPYAEERSKLCQHARSTVGCPACRLLANRLDLPEARSERLRATETCETRQDELTQAGNDQIRETAQYSLDKAQEWSVAWDTRIESIESTLVQSRAAVKAICGASEPDTLVEAFAEFTEKEMSRYQEIWHAATGNKLPEYDSADPDFNVPFEGLDHSQIPATANCSVSEGEGLHSFVYAGRSPHEERTSQRTVGETTGPAYTSHGHALHMFGEPSDPGDDFKPAATKGSFNVPSDDPTNEPSDNVEQSTDDLTAQLLEALEKASIECDSFASEEEQNFSRPKVLERYDDAKLGFSPPTQYYTGPSLLEEDMKKLGYTFPKQK